MTVILRCSKKQDIRPDISCHIMPYHAMFMTHLIYFILHFTSIVSSRLSTRGGVQLGLELSRVRGPRQSQAIAGILAYFRAAGTRIRRAGVWTLERKPESGNRSRKEVENGWDMDEMVKPSGARKWRYIHGYVEWRDSEGIRILWIPCFQLFSDKPWGKLLSKKPAEFGRITCHPVFDEL